MPEPYVGPRPFDREDEKRFFGRDREADDLLSLVLAHSTVLVYAASGAGKSSLLNAGLIPRLLKEDFQIFGPVRVTGPVPPAIDQITNIYRFHVLSQLGNGLSPSEFASLSLTDFFRRLDEHEPGRPRALIFDQFEEFFTANIAPSEQRRAFIEDLAEALRVVARLKVVFAMREEQIAQFELFAQSLPDKLRTRMWLEPLRERAAVEAICRPLEAFDLVFDEGPDNPAEALVHELLKVHIDAGPNEVREGTGEFVEPVQLQVVCQNMWRNFPEEVKAYAAERQGTPREKKIISRDQIRIGDVDQALASYYDGVIEDAVRASEASEGELRRWFNSSLITGAGRRSIALASSNETAQLPEAALKVFLMQRLVRKESREGSEWYELTHDRFIEPIQHSNRAWFDQRAVSQALLRKLEVKAGTAGALLDESETHNAEAFLASPEARILGPSPQVESLVRASRVHIKKEVRQRRIKLTLAWSTFAILLIALLWSIHERNNAQAAEQRATDQKKIAQAETLRARKQNFENMSAMEQMANRLVELSAPQEALFWHQQRAGALSVLGKHEESIKEYDLVLQADPGNLRAKINRGYEHYTQREAEKALEDTESYLQKAPGMWIAHQNRGIYLSLLGRYDEAEREARHAIRQFRSEGVDFGENEVAPDIQKATGRTTLAADEKVVQAANYYQLANLKAYIGSTEFDAALTEADKQANKQHNSTDAALIALDWAWLQMDKRKSDYGALVAQGALWERAGFKDWAKKYYLDFERTHKQIKEKRYEDLARWAANRLAVLKSYREPIKEESSVNMLTLEANELVAQQTPEKLQEALERINRAIEIAPNDVTLYLTRAGIFFQKKQYPECKSDCDHILSEAPDTPNAYVWRAVANKSLKGSSEMVEQDLREALECSPGDGSTMEILSDVLYDRAEKEGFETSRHELDEALQLLERGTSAENLSFDQLPYIYYRIARTHCALRNFDAARKSLETAIAIKDDASEFYTLWSQAEKGLGKTDAQISCSLAAVHDEIAETKRRLGNNGKALSACWRGLEALTADEKQLNEREVREAMARTMSEISQIIERAGSRAKAKEFWQSIVELDSMKVLRDAANGELVRLGTSH